MVAMMIEDMLEDLGHRVLATSGSMSKASKLVADARADLAILFGPVSGRELAQAIDRAMQR
jgi:hypothetical protein